MINYSAIEDMFYGGRGYYAKMKISEKTSRMMDAVIALEKQLKDLMKDKHELIEAFELFKLASEQYNSSSTADYYAEGFRFGILMGLDVTHEEQNGKTFAECLVNSKVLC